MVEMKTHGKKTVEGETFFFIVFFNAFFQKSLSPRLHTMSLYSKMPSKRPLASHGTCGIVNRPSDHNSVMSKGCQTLKISTQINLKSILPFSRSTYIIHLQLLPESLDGIAYIDMILYFAIQLGREIAIMHLKSQADFFQFFMPNNGMALLSLRLNLSESIYPLARTFIGGGNDSSKEGSGRSLYYEADDLFSDLLKDENEGSALTRSDYIAFKVTKLLQVYFDVALQDMSDSLLCTLLPMIFFRINAMFPDKAFSIEVSLSSLFEVVIPKEVKTLQKPITSQPQTSDSKVAQSHQLLKKTVWRRIEDHHCCLRLSPWSGEAGDECKDGPCLAAYTA
ncbi:hypothetical protein SELMODRAFT_427837 [Selaginella moellendorffii]|uniref:Uncharacterized protein n=1 Tax=Selaginella moellendorffii TaxID=88036 RepID=D8T0V4_SELML|nr:hypothetical protein SELMODRAFT_427837 [Selaginella moellendorffii]